MPRSGIDKLSDVRRQWMVEQTNNLVQTPRVPPEVFQYAKGLRRRLKERPSIGYAASAPDLSTVKSEILPIQRSQWHPGK